MEGRGERGRGGGRGGGGGEEGTLQFCEGRYTHMFACMHTHSISFQPLYRFHVCAVCMHS